MVVIVPIPTVFEEHLEDVEFDEAELARSGVEYVSLSLHVYELEDEETGDLVPYELPGMLFLRTVWNVEQGTLDQWARKARIRRLTVEDIASKVVGGKLLDALMAACS